MKNKTENKLKYLKFIFKITVSIILLIFIFYFIGINKILIQLKNINIFFLLIAFIFVFFQIFFKALKWNVVIRMFKKRLDLYHSFVYTTISLAFGIVTPGRVGEFIKAKYLVDKTQLKYRTAFVTVIMDKSFDLIAILFIAFIGISALGNIIRYSEFFMILFIIFLFILLFLFIYFNSIPKIVSKLLPKKYKLNLKNLRFTKWLYSKALFYSIIIWSIYVVESFFIFKALNIENPVISGLMIIVALMALSSAIPISFGGTGVREIVAVAFLTLFGIEAEKSAIYALLFTFISFGVPAIIGAFLYIKEKGTFGK